MGGNVTLIEAAVWVFWAVSAIVIVRMLVSSKRAGDADTGLAALRAELVELRVKERLEALEAGQATLNNKFESNKVTQMRRRREWGA